MQSLKKKEKGKYLKHRRGRNFQIQADKQKTFKWNKVTIQERFCQLYLDHKLQQLLACVTASNGIWVQSEHTECQMGLEEAVSRKKLCSLIFALLCKKPLLSIVFICKASAFVTNLGGIWDSKASKHQMAEEIQARSTASCQPCFSNQEDAEI